MCVCRHLITPKPETSFNTALFPFQSFQDFTIQHKWRVASFEPTSPSRVESRSTSVLRDAAAGAACKHVAALGRAAARLHPPTMIRRWTDFCGDAHRLKTIRINTMKWAIFQKLEMNNIGNFRPLEMDRVSVRSMNQSVEAQSK
jgi:hypothetical protein